MKTKITLILLLIIAAACLTFGLTACSQSSKASYDYLVTFNYNTESLNLEGDFENQYLGVNAGSHIMQPCKPGTKQYKYSNFKEKQIARYEIQGWYTAKYDENGEVLTQDGNVVLDKKWDFAKDTVDANMTLYAYLELKPAMRLIIDGELEKVRHFVIGRSVSRTNFNPVDPKKDGCTFYDYYVDEGFTQKFTFPYTVGDDDINVYAKFIDGANWKIVSTAKAFCEAYHASAKIFVDDDLDFEEENAEWKSRLEFGGEINGNNHTLKNINCALSSTASGVQINFGLFGTLQEASYVHDVTFENVNVTVSTTTSVPIQAALFAWTIKDGAKLENVTVSGTISKGTVYEGGDVSLSAVCSIGNSAGETVKNCDFSAIIVNEDKKGEDS